MGQANQSICIVSFPKRGRADHLQTKVIVEDTSEDCELLREPLSLPYCYREWNAEVLLDGRKTSYMSSLFVLTSVHASPTPTCSGWSYLKCNARPSRASTTFLGVASAATLHRLSLSVPFVELSRLLCFRALAHRLPQFSDVCRLSPFGLALLTTAVFGYADLSRGVTGGLIDALLSDFTVEYPPFLKTLYSTNSKIMLLQLYWVRRPYFYPRPIE